MNRQSSAFAAVGMLGLSAVMLSACGRTPTGPEATSISAPTREAVVAATAPDAGDGDASPSAREEELAARERELRAQEDALRREREQLAADPALAAIVSDPRVKQLMATK